MRDFSSASHARFIPPPYCSESAARSAPGNDDTPPRSVMADWWTELESAILNCLEHVGTVTPAEIGRRLGIPEAATASLLSVQVRDGKVRIRLVELARGDSDALETNAAPFRRGLA